MDFINSHNINVFYFTDVENFPSRLCECDDAPILLFGLGTPTFNCPHVVSIVGTRHATVYGTGFVKDFITELSNSLEGLMVVSGLAYGIDVEAHRQSLECNVPTTAVVAHGLSTIYPAAHRNIAAKMVKEGGMILTDYRHDARIMPANFLARNRIVAGMADCTIVVESAIKGGAMTTAHIASAYNRDVFALPGRNTDKYSAGCNRLIAENSAMLIQQPTDIIEFMGWETTKQNQRDSLFYQPTPEEQAIIDFLTTNGDGFINRIAVATGISIHRLMGLLVDMEFKGLVVNQPGGLYRLK